MWNRVNKNIHLFRNTLYGRILESTTHFGTESFNGVNTLKLCILDFYSNMQNLFTFAQSELQIDSKFMSKVAIIM